MRCGPTGVATAEKFDAVADGVATSSVCVPTSPFVDDATIVMGPVGSSTVTMAPGALGALTSSGSTSAPSEENVTSSFFASMPAGASRETMVVHRPSAVSVHGAALSIEDAGLGTAG